MVLGGLNSTWHCLLHLSTDKLTNLVADIKCNDLHKPLQECNLGFARSSEPNIV